MSLVHGQYQPKCIAVRRIVPLQTRRHLPHNLQLLQIHATRPDGHQRHNWHVFADQVQVDQPRAHRLDEGTEALARGTAAQLHGDGVQLFETGQFGELVFVVGEEGERLDVRARGEDELEEVLARLEPLGRLVEVGEPEDAVVGFVGICRRESQETVLRLYIQPYLDLVTNK